LKKKHYIYLKKIIMKKKIATQDDVKRLDKCIQENLCFITLKPLNKNYTVIYHTGLSKMIKVNLN